MRWQSTSSQSDEANYLSLLSARWASHWDQDIEINAVWKSLPLDRESTKLPYFQTLDYYRLDSYLKILLLEVDENSSTTVRLSSLSRLPGIKVFRFSSLLIRNALGKTKAKEDDFPPTHNYYRWKSCFIFRNPGWNVERTRPQRKPAEMEDKKCSSFEYSLYSHYSSWSPWRCRGRPL